MARRRRKILLGLLATLILLPVVLVVAMRLLRGQASAPVKVRGGIIRVRNLFTEMYGKRVGGGAVLFDAGIDGQGRALDSLLANLGVAREAVTDVFLSHGHFDHVAASPLCTRARIRVGQADVKLLAHQVAAGRASVRWFQAALPVDPIQATDPLDGRVTIPLADGTVVTAIPLPGHTRGSYVMFHEGVLFAGDSLQLDGDRLELAMTPFSDDMASNRASIARLKEQLGQLRVEVVCTGHQGCTPDGRGGPMLEDLIARSSAP